MVTVLSTAHLVALSDIVTSPRSSLNWQLKCVQHGREILHARRKEKGLEGKALFFLSQNNTHFSVCTSLNILKSTEMSPSSCLILMNSLSVFLQPCHIDLNEFDLSACCYLIEINMMRCGCVIQPYTRRALWSVYLYILMRLDVQYLWMSEAVRPQHVHSTCSLRHYSLFSLLSQVSGCSLSYVCEAEKNTRGSL